MVIITSVLLTVICDIVIRGQFLQLFLFKEEKIMKQRNKAVSMLCVIVLGITILAGCESKNVENADTSNQENYSNSDAQQQDETGGLGEAISVVWPTWNAGENVGADYWEPAVERFNEQNAGKYEIIIEESPQADHTDKMKQLYLQGKLPFLVQHQDQDWIRDVIIPNKGYYDLSGWLEEHPEIKAQFLEDSLDYNTLEDGSVVAVPTANVSVNALYYNSTLLGNSTGNLGDLTWDEFFALLDENQGTITLNTGENALDSGLFLSAFLASEEGGAEMMMAALEEGVYDYTSDIWINAFTSLQEIWEKYAAPNGVGAAYADIANTFMSNNAAVIANGVWMMGEFEEASKDKWSNDFEGANVNASTYPGNIAFATNAAYGGLFIPATASDEEIEVALAFLTFLNSAEELETSALLLGGNLPNVKSSETFEKAISADRLKAQFADAVTSETLLVPHIYQFMPTSICREEFPKLLPKLIDGSMTPVEFAQELTNKASELIE